MQLIYCGAIFQIRLKFRGVDLGAERREGVVKMGQQNGFRAQLLINPDNFVQSGKSFEGGAE